LAACLSRLALSSLLVTLGAEQEVDCLPVPSTAR